MISDFEMPDPDVYKRLKEAAAGATGQFAPYKQQMADAVWEMWQSYCYRHRSNIDEMNNCFEDR